MANNPRRSNGNARNKLRARLKAEGRACWICQAFGRDGTIDYSLPAGHPGAFEVDELVPVSRYWEGGYSSREAAALDYNNLASVHRACNQWRGNKSVDHVMAIAQGRAPMKRGSYPNSRNWRSAKGKLSPNLARALGGDGTRPQDPTSGTF